ncbi:hypothetical protein [Virgibacillus salexigens]|uniref:LPXTG cell wall anchor domain-containing protein n=1 Tax=Virgibacillus massiliensis TaxID=1462526 RepID=A0A024QAP8_9BACI|nr:MULTISPECIES: hypothetical protein [Virgibacillus]MYL40247.1 hypothetical protein [Virgibacillus massiliensis]CDQ38986.1 hypothetical protein BN990_01266 [Virgibacillus massiliensis]
MRYKVLLLLILTFVFTWFGIHRQFIAYADDSLSMEITPNKILFDIENMKPGDWAPRTVEVTNNGANSFDYSVVLKNKGSEKLFNQLDIHVNSGNKVFYEGKLHEFKQLTFQDLSPSDQQEVTFTVRFPEHLGNNYQALNTTFSLVFIAEGEGNSTDEQHIVGKVNSDNNGNNDGGTLPNTATNIFLYVTLGFIFIAIGGFLYLIIRMMKRMNVSSKL